MASYNVEDMLLNLDSSLNPLIKMGTGAMYVVGISLALKALYNLKVYGEARSMMASHTSAKEPIINLIIAGMLIYLPTGFDILNTTLFGSPNIMAYSDFPTASGMVLSQPAQVLLHIIQVVGVFAVLKGWTLLARSSGQGAQPGAFGKGLMHVVGGVAAINIVATANVISSTFGITF